MTEIIVLPGVGPALALHLARLGIRTLEDVAAADAAVLATARGISPAKAEYLRTAARNLLTTRQAIPAIAPPARTPDENEGKPEKKDKKTGKKKSKPKGKKSKDKASKPKADKSKKGKGGKTKKKNKK
jgi:nucleotidyltransferase/DNA polymerase involved in DNA repair